MPNSRAPPKLAQRTPTGGASQQTGKHPHNLHISRIYLRYNLLFLLSSSNLLTGRQNRNCKDASPILRRREFQDVHIVSNSPSETIDQLCAYG